MRGIAEAVGWLWVGFNGVVSLYSISTMLTSGPQVWLFLIAAGIVLASPGFLLIWWGRRRPRNESSI